jgi:hypothetical protein
MQLFCRAAACMAAYAASREPEAPKPAANNNKMWLQMPWSTPGLKALAKILYR